MNEEGESQRSRGRPKGAVLSRDQVLAAAVALIDREGPESLSMRRLAGAVGVTPMALYNHFSGKQDLLRSVAEHLVAHVEFACEGPDWRQRIRFCFGRLRGVILAHPGAVRLMSNLETAPMAVFRPMEITLAALEDAGLADDAAVRAYFLLTNFTMGQAAYEAGEPADALDPAKALASGGLETGGFEHIERAVAFERWDFDAAFDFGLTVIIAGLEQVGRQSRPSA
jgi:AcrR family transcriptional regulator